MNNESAGTPRFIPNCFCIILRYAAVAVTVLLFYSHAFGGVIWDLSGDLHKAAQSGNADEVRTVLEADPELVSSIDINTNTPLHLAVVSHHENIVKLLLAYNADVNAKDKSGETPLDLAAERDQTNIAKVLLAHGAKIGDALVRTCALPNARKDMVQLLLANGADANARNGSGNAPLDVTSDPEIAQLLLAGGAKVNAKDNNGETAMDKSAQNADMAKWLIAHKADINARDANGYRPLDYAVLWGAIFGDKQTTDLLIANGADVTAKSNNGETALWLTVAEEPTATLLVTNAMAIQKDFVKLFLAHGADVNAKGPVGYAPLHAAVLAENNAMVELLLANKADVNAKDDKGETPLRLAIDKSNGVIATTLRQHGGHE